MNLNTLRIVLVFSIAMVAAAAHAYERPIRVEWTKYTAPIGLTTMGFRLYQEGAPVCNFQGADAVAGDCTVNLTKLDTSFTLTATFPDNKESPQSSPYVFRDYGPPPQGLKITVVTVRTVSSFTSRGNITAKTTVTTKEVPADTVVDAKPINYWNSKTKQYISQTTLVM